MERMENSRPLEKEPESAVQKLESGNLTPEERVQVEKLYSESARYGAPLPFQDFENRTGQSMSISDNYVKLQANIARHVGELQVTAQVITYNDLSVKQQRKLDSTVYTAPELIPPDTPDLAKLTPRVSDMRVDQLEDVMLEEDYRRAENVARQKFDPYTGEPMPSPATQPDAFVDKVAELSRWNTVERHFFQNAAQYQLEVGRYINYGGRISGEEYFHNVKQALSPKSD